MQEEFSRARVNRASAKLLNAKRNGSEAAIAEGQRDMAFEQIALFAQKTMAGITLPLTDNQMDTVWKIMEKTR